MPYDSSARPSRVTRWVVAISVFLIAFSVSGLAVDWLLAREGTYSHLKLFNEILLLVGNNYVEDVDEPALMQGAFEGLLSTLDPQSEYLTHDQYERLTGRAASEEADVGLDLTRRGGYLAVVSTLPGSPAAEAGLQAGERLRRIAGVSTRDLTLSEARLLLRGKEGTEVTLQRFPRSGEEAERLTLSRVRRRPERPEVRDREGILVVRLPTLASGTTEALRAALKGRVGGDSTLLIDLRGNSTGGYDEAAEAASLFLSGGEVGRIRGRQGEERPLTARRGAPAGEARIGLLVDGATAGPAELLAQALRLRADGLLLGRRTFGRGTLQDYIPLNDGGYLRLSVARCVDSEGIPWDGNGLTPDRELSAEGETEDPLLTAALEALRRPAEAAAA